MSLEFRITGLDDVIQNLRTLAANQQKAIARKAARKAMNIVRDAARINARAIDDPETAAIIQKNIITQESTRAGQRVGGIVMRVGVQGGASSNQHSKKIMKKVRGTKHPKGDGSLIYLPGGDTRHWRFIEIGTSTIRSVPFMRKAFNSNVDSVMTTFATEFSAGVAEAIRT